MNFYVAVVRWTLTTTSSTANVLKEEIGDFSSRLLQYCEVSINVEFYLVIKGF